MVKVESTKSGNLFWCAIFETISMFITSRPGLPRVSPNIKPVFYCIADFIFLGFLKSTKEEVIPNLGNVYSSKLWLPP